MTNITVKSASMKLYKGATHPTVAIVDAAGKEYRLYDVPQELIAQAIGAFLPGKTIAVEVKQGTKFPNITRLELHG